MLILLCGGALAGRILLDTACQLTHSVVEGEFLGAVVGPDLDRRSGR